MGKEFTVRKANRKDLLRIAEIQVFNYRLYFYPIFLSDEYYFDELSVPSLMQKYESELDSLYVYDDGVVMLYQIRSWDPKMVEERKHQHDSSMEKKNW